MPDKSAAVNRGRGKGGWISGTVGLAGNGSVGNLVPGRGDQRGVGGRAINNQTGPLLCAPSFVLSDLPFPFTVERGKPRGGLKKEQQALRGREVNRGVTGKERQHRGCCYSPQPNTRAQLNRTSHSLCVSLRVSFCGGSCW